MFLPEDPNGLLDACYLAVVGGDKEGMVLSGPAVGAKFRFRVRSLAPDLPHLRVAPDTAFFECFNDILVGGITVDDQKHAVEERGHEDVSDRLL